MNFHGESELSRVYCICVFACASISNVVLFVQGRLRVPRTGEGQGFL